MIIPINTDLNDPTTSEEMEDVMTAQSDSIPFQFRMRGDTDWTDVTTKLVHWHFDRYEYRRTP